MSEYVEMFKNRNYCLSEIGEARKVFTTKPFTADKAEALMKGLGLMLLYCPDDIYDIVLATIREAEVRVAYAVHAWA